MGRRYAGHMQGERFCGNLRERKIHDLDRENGACRIGELLVAGLDLPFSSLSSAHLAGYDDCGHCVTFQRRPAVVLPER